MRERGKVIGLREFKLLTVVLLVFFLFNGCEKREIKKFPYKNYKYGFSIAIYPEYETQDERKMGEFTVAPFRSKRDEVIFISFEEFESSYVEQARYSSVVSLIDRIEDTMRKARALMSEAPRIEIPNLPKIEKERMSRIKLNVKDGEASMFFSEEKRRCITHIDLYSDFRKDIIVTVTFIYLKESEDRIQDMVRSIEFFEPV